VIGEIVAARSPNVQAVIDLSTIGVTAARKAANVLASANIGYLDAPVSGGVAGARARKITVMCAGDKALYTSAQPLLQAIAGRTFHVGDAPGQAQALKLLNNFLSATALAATSEAVAFGVKEGLEIGTILDVLNVSSGQSAATSDKFVSHVATGTYSAGFTNTLMAKDLGLFHEATAQARATGPINQLVLSIWDKFNTTMPNVDFTRIYTFVQQHNLSSVDRR
jgi:3-hydroxyisobutyrate dehydrogenase